MDEDSVVVSRIQVERLLARASEMRAAYGDWMEEANPGMAAQCSRLFLALEELLAPGSGE